MRSSAEEEKVNIRAQRESLNSLISPTNQRNNIMKHPISAIHGGAAAQPEQPEPRPCDIILQQFGGSRRLQAMVGATQFYGEGKNGEGLSFRFKMCPAANWIKVRLNSMDTYDVEFIKVGRLNPKTFEIPKVTVQTYSDVYCDMLIPIFEKFTGLYLSIGSLGRRVV